MRAAAVIVTYNRRELLEQTLAGIEAQTTPPAHVVIIDNASTDATEEYLAQREFAFPTTVTRLPENTGGAGGFAAGTAAAYELGLDAMWLMDDDTVPQPEALEELVNGLERASDLLGYLPSFACSLVLWKDGTLCEMNTPEPTWDFARPIALGADFTLMKSCSFVSVLVTREAVHAVGLPSANFFIWYDDAEYTQRLSKYRPGIFLPSSKVNHLLPQNRGVNFGDVNDGNIWKFEYGVRNQIASARVFRSPTLAASLAENMVKQLTHSKVPWRLRIRLAKAAVKGITFRPQIEQPKTVR
ncbi:glycosyltransferase family 2 protein [Sanguibacter inulinus]|uniref:Glycosyltransferase family 2 protein n=1 Tax=Sanguibacter inulinus TaxID=60922 RepID=A0A853EVH7_9MICO|nr:glycosyltransferase family 2 protein [Sanguibacter inulinus]MBF0723295.1 glycosyltransferase family 2 protein [Sanguibacter inulinus]NYS94440.1 glycosyltransferase family 2 protein [Sanguibacter inulinus]